MNGRHQHQRQWVTVAVDGSLPARRAVRLAAREAMLRRLPLRIVTATLWPEIQQRPGRDFEPPERRALADVDATLLEAADLATEILPPSRVGTVAAIEPTDSALLYESRFADLIVVGTRGLGAVRHVLLGSVSGKLAAHAACPVLVVPDGVGQDEADTPVLVGVEDAEDSAPALEAAFAEARLHRAPVRALHAVALPLLAGPAAMAPMAYEHIVRPDDATALLQRALAPFRARYPDVAADTTIVEGPAPYELVEAGHTARMLVLAHRRRTGADAVLHGSVTRGVLHHATCPVLVVHPQAET